MKNYRYGKFRLSDYYSAWMGILFLLTIGIAGCFLAVSRLLCIYALVLSICLCVSIIIPNLEYFFIQDNTIVVCRGKKRQTVVIPDETILIISYADVCPPFAKRVGTGKRYMLKGKYAISILRKMPLTTVLECLHRNRIRKYTNNTIEESFYDHQYIYSFVCNQTLMERLLSKTDGVLIVPESLSKKVSFNLHFSNIHIDKGY